jgi:hypothetical protein
MGESHRVAVHCEHLSLDGLIERGARAIVAGGCGQHEIDCGARERGGGEQNSARRCRDAGQAGGKEFWQARWGRERLTRNGIGVRIEQRPSELDGEKRVATGCLVDPAQRGAEEDGAKARPQDLVQVGQVERADRQAMNLRGRQGLAEGEPIVL